MKITAMLTGIRERHLYRVMVIYAAVAWLLVQVADVVAESFDWPELAMQGIIVLAVAGFPLVLALFWFIAPRREETRDEAVPAPIVAGGGKPSLLVFPFDCYSDERGDQWEADALTEDITTMAARFSEYAVIARNTATAYKQKGFDTRELRADLGVRYVLEGSLRRLPGSIRVTAQLIETETGAHLWAENYDRPADQYTQLRDELCRAIALKLGNELTRAEMHLSRRKAPAEWDAWDLYQQAKGKLQFSGWSSASFRAVADLLEKAIEKDPGYANAHAYLALILALGYWARLFPDREATFDASLAAAELAMSLAPESSEVLGFVGCALSDLGQHERGVPIIERAIELNPSNSQAFAALGAAKVVSGRLDEGIENLRHAVELSPADPGLAPWSAILSVAESYLGHHSSALGWAERARKADPRYFGAYVALAMANAGLGREEESRLAVQEALKANPDLTEESITALVGEPAWAALAGIGISLPQEGDGTGG